MKKLWRKLYYSLSTRLFMLALFTAISLMMIMNISFQAVVRENFRHQVKPHVDQYLNYLSQDIRDNPKSLETLQQQLPLRVYSKEEWHERTAKNGPPGFRRAFSHHFVLLDGKEIVIQLSDSGAKERRSGLLFVSLGATVLVLFIAWLIAVRTFRPFRVIRDGVQRIGQGDLSSRIEVQRKNEFGELAESINSMSDDIQKMLEAKRGLLLAMSHELRSPVTRAKVSAALLEPSKSRDAIEHDLNEMETIIHELLESERLASRHAVLNRSTQNINELIKELCDEHFDHSRIMLDLDETIENSELDAARIRLLLKNLLSNALRHSDNDQTVLVKTQKTQEGFRLIVSDHGEGIDAEPLVE